MRILTTLVASVLFTLPLYAEGLTPQNLTPEGFGGARQPQITVAPSGEIYVVFGKDKAIYLETSTDHGATFSAPMKVADASKLLLGMRRGPRVAATAHRIVVTAPGSDLASYISEDDGKTWSQPSRVNDKSDSAREGLQNITALPDGSFYAVWLDDRTGAKVLEGARLDLGATEWSKNVVIYTSPDKTICECCHPNIVTDAKGKLTAMWRNVVGGNRDFYIAESSDRGDSFGSATKLGEGSWRMNACPMDGGNIVATPDGVTTIWRRMTDVYLDQPGQPETKLGSGAQPVLAQVAGKFFGIWQQGANLVVTADSGRTPVATLSGGYPSSASSPDGKEAYLVWDHAEAGVGTPQFAVLR